MLAFHISKSFVLFFKRVFSLFLTIIRPRKKCDKTTVEYQLAANKIHKMIVVAFRVVVFERLSVEEKETDGNGGGQQQSAASHSFNLFFFWCFFVLSMGRPVVVA